MPKTRYQEQRQEKGSHPQLIEPEQLIRQKIDYIHHNPVKRSYVDLSEHWKYSSACNYDVMDGLIGVTLVW